MDINDLRSLATVACFFALMGVFWWAYTPKHKRKFEQDAQLVFGDEVQQKSANKESDK